jgi:hypothetical protein
MQDAQARGNLRHALSKIRKAQPKPPAGHTPRCPSVALDPSTVDVDAVWFERLVADGRPAALEQVAGLYRGDLLAGLALWYQQGRTEPARELLAPLYGRFTVGFDTADLRAARTLLGSFGLAGRPVGEMPVLAISVRERSAVLGRRACFQPIPEGGGDCGELPLGKDVAGHGPQGSGRERVGSLEAAVEEPRLEAVGIGVIRDRGVQQRALERHPDRIRGGVALPPASPAVGGIEGREKGAAEHRGSQRGHDVHGRHLLFRSRDRSTRDVHPDADRAASDTCGLTP